ncbi:hypothetical protein GALMADRAFT_139852 [Galerina marginata CBS 339.88]|uniref:Uncharacterized protein n=1 Tax=Galerina marginata (strain CBS 339.88) TaxID=685588 RepID=A0A067T1A9_GALM3|nr:hypothetical protein GALMADRAFT_139852 [Galerina marginata CBS 339.88]
MSSVKLGIAFYAQQDSRGRPVSPHWALVAHPTNYAAHDVQVFQIVQNGGSWAPMHHICPLARAPTLLGVVHVADINMSPTALDAFVRPFPATKNNDDPSGNIVWSCSNWVIRVLHHLAGHNVLRLPWRVNLFYDRVQPRIAVLKSTPKDPRVPVAVIPLVG